MDLDAIQRSVFEIVRQPLTASENMRKRTSDGKSVRMIIEKIVKPNDRLTSFERLEIYNRVYWFRLLSSLAEDFPGLRAVIGQRRFDKALRAYLIDCPSVSFSLRDLGSRMPNWIRNHPDFVSGRERLAIDMARLEWADIEAFDGLEHPILTNADLRTLGDDPRFWLQPYLSLLDLEYPIDKLLLKIRRNQDQDTDVASNVVLEREHEHHLKRYSMPKPKKVYLAVHRQDLVVYFKRLKKEEYALLRAIQNGNSLSESIDEAVVTGDHQPDLILGQLSGWFANWSSMGWFCKPKTEQ